MLNEDQYSLYGRAVKLHRENRHNDAAKILEHLIASRPFYADPYIYLSDMARDAGHYAQVIALARECWAKTADPKALRRLIAAYVSVGEVTRAVTAYRYALSIMPDDAEIYHDAALNLLDAGKVMAAESLLRRSLEINQNPRRESNMLVVQQCITDCPRRLDIAHKTWVERYVPTTFPSSPSVKRIKRATDRLRVGILSSDLRKHPVGYFLLPFLQHATHTDVFLYCDDNQWSDEMTDTLRSYAAGWRSVAGLPDRDVQRILSAANLHVLVEADGHTSTRLGVYARRLAPLQVSWPGYYYPLHHPGIDGLLLDNFSASEMSSGVIQINPTRFCYSPPTYAPVVAPPPCLQHGYVTFGCFNNIQKLSDDTVALWSRVLHALSRSRLLLKWWSLGDAGVRATVLDRFAAHGIGAERLELRGHSPHPAMLAEYGDVDIALDPSPFGGGLTSYEALWMGVPVLTLPSRSPASRQTGAALSCLDRTEWVAHSPDDFVCKAVALALSPTAMAELRTEQRRLMVTSALCDGARFAAELRRTFVQALGWVHSP